MKKILFTLAAAAAILAGCSEEFNVETPENPIEAPAKSFVCSFAMNQPTKTTITEDAANNKYNIFWEEDDVIEVKYSGNNYTESYRFAIQPNSLSSDKSTAIFVTYVDVPADFFESGKTYKATFGSLETEITATEGNANHIPMEAETTTYEFEFKASTAVLAITIPDGVEADKVVVRTRGTSAADIRTVRASSALKTFYIPVEASASTSDSDKKQYEFKAYNGSDEIAESMKMQIAATMNKEEIYPFEFTPTLEIAEAGTYSLKSYPAKYNVRFTGSEDLGEVTVQYATGTDAEHPSDVDVNAKNLKITTFNIYTIDSHVEIANGSATNVQSKTNTSTLVVKPSFTIDQKLTVQAGSVTAEGKEGTDSGKRNVKEIVLDYANEEAMQGVIVSVSDVTVGEPVTITNKTTSVGENATPITVVGKDNSGQSSSNNGGYKIEDGTSGTQQGTQNIQKLETVAAKVGNTVYATLAEAFAAVNEGETIVVLQDITQAGGECFTKNINAILDLNKKTFKVTGSSGSDGGRAIKITAGNLTIKNGTIDGRSVNQDGTPNDNPSSDGPWSATRTGGCVRVSGGNAVLEDLVLYNNDGWGNAVKIESANELTVRNCQFNSVYGAGIEVGVGTANIYSSVFTQKKNSQSQYTSTCIAVCSGGTANLYDTNTADGTRSLYVYNSGGTLNVYGGNYSAIEKAIWVDGQQYSKSSDKSRANIFGGNFVGAINVEQGIEADKPYVVISGGTFSVEPAAGYIATGCEAVADGDNWVVKAQSGNVAKIGDVTYATLQEAFAAVGTQTGITLELLADVDLKNEVWTPAVFNNNTFDGKGHTVKNLKVSGQKMQGFIGNGDCSTIKNLTIDGANVTGINHVGVIAGRGMCTKIENCHVKNATVTSNVDNNDDGDKVAAICGYLSGEWQAWVRNCSVENTTVTGYRDLGAIVGYAECYATTATNTGIADISGCSAKNVQVICKTDNNYKGYSSKSEFHAGQIVGELTANATASNNTATNVKVTYNPDVVSSVAKVGTTEYTDLHAALEAAKTAGSTCELIADVDLKGVEWTPIEMFNGTFDGNGFTVSNLSVTGSGNDGMFKNLHSAVVKNLTIDNACIKSTGDNVGILAADFHHTNDSEDATQLKNVKITNSTLETSGQYAGAFFGEGYGHIDECEVTCCKITANEQAGAALGFMISGYIQNCVVTGNTVNAGDRAGGLIGKFQVHSDNTDTIWVANNVISGTVTATSNVVGGIAAQIMGNISGYSITNNTIDCPGTNCPIATLRDGQNAAFTGALATNITGNTWTTATYNAQKYTYTNVASGVSEQVIWNGECPYVAKVGETSYESLAEALKAAESGATIEILDGVWGPAAVGSLTTAEAGQVRYKSLTIQPVAGANPTFTSQVYLGYDDSSTANAVITVKNLNFVNASLALSNYNQATVEGCTFKNTTNTAGTLIVQDACCKTKKSSGEYPASQITIKDCTIDGSNTGASGIRLRDSGNVSITGTTVKNSRFNGILFESNASVDNTAAKTVSITGNTITNWNADNKSESGRAMRMDMGTMASGSKITIEGNVFEKAELKKATLEDAAAVYDTPDFIKLTNASAATISLENNYWNGWDASDITSVFCTVNGSAPTINSVMSSK